MKIPFMAAALMAALLGPASATVYTSPMQVNGGLQSGDEMKSANGKYSLILQSGDGNLVVYRLADMKPLWASYAYGGTVAVVQPDGNFVVYNTRLSPPPPLWHSYTGGRPSSSDVVLWLRDDGSLGLTYNGGEVWSSPPDPTCPNGETRVPYVVCVTTRDAQLMRVVPGCGWEDALTIARRAFDAVSVSSGECWTDRVPE